MWQHFDPMSLLGEVNHIPVRHFYHRLARHRRFWPKIRHEVGIALAALRLIVRINPLFIKQTKPVV
jgi:hypothetical protein